MLPQHGEEAVPVHGVPGKIKSETQSPAFMKLGGQVFLRVLQDPDKDFLDVHLEGPAFLPEHVRAQAEYPGGFHRLPAYHNPVASA